VTMRLQIVVLPALVSIIAAGTVPQAAMGQSTPRSAVDRPSENRETRTQHDSLAVHFARKPKVKSHGPVPGTQARTSAPRIMPQETPLPEKRGGRGKP
jgi:hypothetical protein